MHLDGLDILMSGDSSTNQGMGFTWCLHWNIHEVVVLVVLSNQMWVCNEQYGLPWVFRTYANECSVQNLCKWDIAYSLVGDFGSDEHPISCESTWAVHTWFTHSVVFRTYANEMLHIHQWETLGSDEHPIRCWVFGQHFGSRFFSHCFSLQHHIHVIL